MANLPSHEQLQEDPFGFRDEYRDSAEPGGTGFFDTAFPTPSEYGNQVRQYDAGRPTSRSSDELGTRVVPRGGQVFDPSFDAKRNNLARGRSPLPATADPIDPVTLPASRTPLAVDSPPQAQDATQDGGSFSVRNLFAPGDYEALSQIMHDLAVHDPAGKKERQSAQADSLAANPARRLGLTGGSALMVAAADTQNRGNGRGPLPLSVATKDIEQKQPAVTTAQSDPTKTIAKGRTLGPGLTLSQTESGEVAAFGPDGQVVDLKDKGVRSRFGLPINSAPKVGYGKRVDGTEKGSGYLGELKMTDGSGRVITELGVGVNIDGKEIEIPAVVPTLSKQELAHILSGGSPTPEIIQKAADHARKRLAGGLSPFANSGTPDGGGATMDSKLSRSDNAPKTANPGTVLAESAPSALSRKQLDVYNADRANGYTGRRDYISPFLTPDQQRARQGEIYAQRQADREAIAQRLATENTIADLESQRTGVPTTSARNRSMLPTSERVMGERQDRAAAEQVATQRAYNMETAKLAATEKDSSMRDTTARRGQDIEDEISRRTAQDNAENRKAQERIAQINAGSKTQRDYQREAMLKARSEAINAALSSDPKSVESPEFKKWLDETYPLMTQDELFDKERATGPDAKQYK